MYPVLWKHLLFLIQHYKGEIPLAIYLKNFYKKNPQLGSRDRKIIADGIYAFYRIAKAIKGTNELELKLSTALLLVGNYGFQPLPENWQIDKTVSIEEKIIFLASQNIEIDLNNLIEEKLQLSSKINRKEWLNNFLKQPQLFIRIRRSKKTIEKILVDKNIDFEKINEECWAFKNGISIENSLPKDSYVVQDYSSQKVGAYLSMKAGSICWDCCSGAGGKALWIADHHPKVRLIVSDIRASILQNLKKRFQQYQMHVPKILEIDVSNANLIKEQLPIQNQFDTIVCDVPCTGSGTWARTPEQAYFFKAHELKKYTENQHQILNNVLPYLKADGKIVYITCSVFSAENESVVNTFAVANNLKIYHADLIDGITYNADCMFVAVLKRQ